jgi:hypothetical protein
MLLAAVGSAENTAMKWNAEQTSVGRDWGRGPTRVNGIRLKARLPGAPATIHALDGTGKRTRAVAAEALGPEWATIWYELTR